MKNYILLLFLVISIYHTEAQQLIDFDKVVVPDTYRPRTMEDYLVQLAWLNNPSNQVLDQEIKIAEEEVEIKRRKWMEDVGAQVNYNESHFIEDFYPNRNPNASNTELFTIYPRFNIGARVQLSTLFTNPRQRRQAEHELKIAELNLNQEKLQIRAETLERYENYLLANEILLTRKQAEEDTYQTYQLIQNKFKQGDAELDEVNKSSTSYYSAKESFLEAKTEVKIARIKVEEMIGVSLEDALKFGPQPKKK